VAQLFSLKFKCIPNTELIVLLEYFTLDSFAILTDNSEAIFFKRESYDYHATSAQTPVKKGLHLG